MFRGSHTSRVDDKGRLKLPAEFRRDLPEAQVFYITSLDGKKAQLYPLQVWEKKEQALGKMPPSHPARTRFLDVTSFWGQVVEMDNQGRLVMPQMLRDKAGLTADVRVIGKLGELEPGFLEVINLEAAEKIAAPLTEEELQALAAFGA
jgi:MraZ protein